LVLVVCAACGERPRENEPAPPASGTPGVTLSAARLRAVERSTGVAPAAALASSSEDVLLAADLQRQDAAAAAQLRRVALARSLLVELKREGMRAGPPSDAEVEVSSQARWWQFARPRMVRVTHAVVMSQGPNEAARALAERIARAVSGTTSASDFRNAAQAVPAEGFTVKVEDLMPVAADGRALDPENPPPVGPGERRFDSDFARAAAALDAVGAKSSVVHSKFGYHVLLLTGSVPELKPPMEERRRMLHDEILTGRSRALTDAVLARQRQAVAPDLDRAALELTERMVTPEGSVQAPRVGAGAP
jgi:hypothetical protein